MQVAERILDEARSQGVIVELVDRQLARRRSTSGGHHQGVAARTQPLPASSRSRSSLARPPRIVTVLDGIEDPQNLGAIIRSTGGAWCGVRSSIRKDRSAGVTPAVIRASSGAAIYIARRPGREPRPWARAAQSRRAIGSWVSMPKDSSKFQDLPRFDRVALVVGSEGSGMRALVTRSL